VIAGRLALSAAIAVCGVVIAARVLAAAAASASYAQAVPGVILGALLILFGVYRIALIVRARSAQRR
jgi:hypothetical protein